MFFKRYSTLILACMMSVTLAGCGISTATYGTGETVEAALARDLASLATFGAIGKKEQKRIAYRERGPLVVPNEQQFASIPEPVDSIEEVPENFPGRAAEIRREREKEERKSNPDNVILNPQIGVARVQALGPDLAKNDEEREGSRNNPAIQNQNVGIAVPVDARELIKTPEDLAKERGITVDELPPALRGGVVRERTILERAGLVQPKRKLTQAQALTEPPVEYRTVKTNPQDKQVEELLDPNAKKKKKKKRFLFF